MELNDWTTFSPNSASKTTDNPTPYFDLGEHLNQSTGNTPTQQESNHNTPGRIILPSSSNHPTPSAQAANSHFSEQDQYFLQQIENNLYSGNTNSKNEASNQPPSRENPNHTSNHQLPDLNLDQFNFMLPDLDFNESSHLQHQQPGQQYDQQEHHHHHHHHHHHSKSSSAYPPSNLPQNTPSMLAQKRIIDEEKAEQDGFVSPILPGQNDHSYNNQHYYHKTSSNTPIKEGYSSHVRPDAVFTPLVSPAVTPLDLQVNINKSKPISASFEPLTSPALNAQPSNDRRRSSSSVFAPSSNDDQKNSINSNHKRRTPHSTPILQANNKLKKSPSLKNSRSNIIKNSSPFENLPESSIDSKSIETTPMLPPQSKKQNIDNNPLQHSNSNSNSNTPTLMGFTMGRLAEANNHDDSTSPVNSRQNSTSKKSSSSSETLPILGSQRTRANSNTSLNSNGTSTSKKKGEKPATKKASHKLAEQGRRNRMNVAVQDLSNLIPQNYHDEVSIPSKATTVELASKYIKDLLNELESLKH